MDKQQELLNSAQWKAVRFAYQDATVCLIGLGEIGSESVTIWDCHKMEAARLAAMQLAGMLEPGGYYTAWALMVQSGSAYETMIWSGSKGSTYLLSRIDNPGGMQPHAAHLEQFAPVALSDEGSPIRHDLAAILPSNKALAKRLEKLGLWKEVPA